MRTFRLSFLGVVLGIVMGGSRVGLGAAGDVLDVTTFGVVGDGVTVNTGGIQKVIDDCAAAGGGVVDFPAGKYLTGTIQVKSGVTLRVEEGATILGSPRVEEYRNLDPFVDGSGNPLGYALIVAVDADRVGIEGKGRIDGQGLKVKGTQKTFVVRPFLVRWVRCTNVTMRDVYLQNPGAWTLNFFQTKGALVEGVTIRSRDQMLRNNDGVNIDSSERVRVKDCDIVSGDDAIVIKSTGTTVCKDIEASDCKLSTRTNAIKLGTESLGGFEGITISHCTVTDTKMAGIALYAVDGGNLEHVTISDVSMDGVMVPIAVRLGARLKTFRAGDVAKGVGKLKDVVIRNVSAKGVGLIGMLINGVPGHCVEGLKLEGIRLTLPGGGTAKEAGVTLGEKEAAYPEFNMFGKVMPAYGMYVRHVRGIALKDVEMTVEKADARPGVVFVDVEGVEPGDFLEKAGK